MGSLGLVNDLVLHAEALELTKPLIEVSTRWYLLGVKVSAA